MNDQEAHNTNGLSAEEVMEHLNSTHAPAPLRREVSDNAMPSPETTEQVEMVLLWEGEQ